MKKLLMIILLGLFFISFASAMNWDNVYSYDEETKTATIENWFGLGGDLAYITLTSGDTLVARGDDRLVGEFNFTPTGDFMDIFGDIYLKDMKNGNEISRGKQFKYKKYTNISVDDYETVCENVTTGNGTVQDCTQVEIGNHWEIQMDWIPINNPTNIFYEEVTYEIGIFVDVEAGDWGDWIPSIMGVEIEEWATWTESINANIEFYGELEQTAGDVIDETNQNNGTNVGATRGIAGKDGNGFDFNRTNGSHGEYISITQIDLLADFTLNVWLKPDENFVGNSNVWFSRKDGLGEFSDRIMINSGPHIFFQESGGSGISSGYTPPNHIGVWKMYSFVRDGDNFIVYVNGLSVANVGPASLGTFSINNLLGSFDGGIDGFDGDADKIAIWSRALTPTEINETLYNEGNANNYTDIFPPTLIVLFPENIIYNETVTQLNYTNSSDAVHCWFSIDNGATNSSPIICGTNFTTTSVGGSNTWIVYGNDSSGIVGSDNVTFFVNKTVETTLISPADGSNITNQQINFSFTSTPLNTILTNTTLYLWNNTDDTLLLTNFTTLSGSSPVTTNFTNVLAEGNYLWNAQTCGEDAGCVNATSNNSFLVHLTIPTASVTAPSGISDFFIVGNNETLNYNFSEPGQNLTEHLEQCWFNYQADYPGTFLSNGTNTVTWNFITGNSTFDLTDRPNILLQEVRINPSIAVLGNSISTTNITLSNFSSTIPNCDTETYGDFVPMNSLQNGQFACLRDDVGFQYIIRLNNFNSSGSNYTSFNRSVNLNCTGNTTDFLYSNEVNNLTIFALDTFGFIASDFTSWKYRLLEINQTYTTPVYETSANNMSANFQYNSSAWSAVTASLIYNETSYTITPIGSINNIELNYELISEAIDDDVNKTFYWTISLTNATGIFSFNSSTQTQEVLKVNFFLCNYSSNPQLFFKTFSTLVPSQVVNATFESAWTINDANGGDVVLSRSFEDSTELNSSWGFCIEPNTSIYTVSVDIVVDATNYTATTHFIVDTDYTGVSDNISLYLLEDDSSTLTEIRVVDQDNIAVQNVYVTIQRYDIGTDTYYNVGMARTDSSGSDLTYLVWFDDWYKFVGVLAGEVVFTDGPKRISSTPQTFKIGEIAELAYEKFGDILYSLIYNDVTENFVLTYVDPSGLTSSNCLRVIKRNITTDYIICKTCEASSSATIYCDISTSGNGTFIASYYASGSPTYWIDQLYELRNVQNQLFQMIGNDNGTGLAILVAGIVVSLFLVTPALGVLGAILGMVLGIALGFQPLDYTAFLGIVVIGGMIMWAVQK